MDQTFFGEQSQGPFNDLRGLPYYDEPSTYLNLAGQTWAWEFNGWKAETMSWKTGCYIHGGLSNTQINFSGPDIIPFFASICTNSFAKFSIGTLKHAVMCSDTGYVVSHGILQRDGEENLSWYAAGGWPVYMVTKTDYRVTPEFVRRFLFQVAGPTSLQTLERAAGESLGDIGFLRFRDAVIAGKSVHIARIGMSGNLAYEVRGELDEGAEVYDAIYQAGQGLGIERLGWRSYLVNHIEGGFPQFGWTFTGAYAEDKDAPPPHGPSPIAVTGSVDPTDIKSRYRNPLEMKWDKAVKFDHEFVGRKALEAVAAAPQRTTVTLRWNPDDVTEIQASLLQPGEEYKTLDLPTSPPWTRGINSHADHVIKDGKRVGVSSGTIYSYFFREFLSMGCIDIDQAEIGNEVIVQWGDFGGRIKDVRATVERYPYLTEERNDEVDTRSKP